MVPVRVGVAVIHHIQAFCIFVKSIHTQLLLNPERDQNGCSHSYGEPNDIDERVNLVFRQVSPHDFNVLFKHNLVIDKDCVLNKSGGNRCSSFSIFFVSYSSLKLFTALLLATLNACQATVIQAMRMAIQAALTII